MVRSVRGRILAALVCALAGLVAWAPAASATVDVYHTTLLPTAGTGVPVALSPDGSLLAEYQGSGVVGLYATATDTLVTTVTASSPTVHALAFWSDSELVLGESAAVEFVTAPSGFGSAGTVTKQSVASGGPVTAVAPVGATRAYLLETVGSAGTIGIADISTSGTIAAGVTALSLPDTYAAIAASPAAPSTLYALTVATTGSAEVEAIPTTGANADMVSRTVSLNATTANSNVAQSLAISPNGSELFVGEDTQLAAISTSTWNQATTTLPSADAGYPGGAGSQPFPSSEPTSCDAIGVSLDGSTVYCSGPNAATAAPNLYWFSAGTLTYDGGYDLSATAPADSAVAAGTQVIAATSSRVYVGLQTGGVASIPVATVLAGAAVPQGSPPGTPTNVAVGTGNSQITVSWSAPADNGGQPITGYTVTAKPITGYDGGGNPIYGVASTWATCNPGGTGTSCTITGLSTWTAYDVTVLATNVLGSSIPSTAVRVTTSVPTVPQGVSVTPGAVTTTGNVSTVSAAVTWTAPASSGGSAIAGYYVCADPSGAAVQTCGAGYPTTVGRANVTVATAGSGGTGGVGNAVAELLGPGARSVSLPSLTLGKTYLVTVTAYNQSSSGNALGQTSAPITIVAGAPSSPTGLTATEGNQTITLSWGAPVSVGSPAFTSYTAVLNPGGIACPGTLAATTLTCTFTGLTDGTSYTASVAAVNTTAASPPATLSGLVPATTPGAPTVKTVTFSGNAAAVTWAAPTTDGGSAITAYTATARSSAGALSCTSTTLTCSIGGLTAGVTYSVTVVATNKIGNGPASVNYTATFTGAPSPVTGVTAALTGGTLQLHWTAPTSIGAQAIVSYDVVATSTDDDQQCTTTGATVCSIAKLQVGQSYSVVVTATNSGGFQSPASAAVTVKPVATPAHPTVARKKAAKRHRVDVTIRWKPVAGATGYQVVRTGGPVLRGTRKAGAKARTLVFRNLPRGRYGFVVAALCAHGRSGYSTKLTVRVK